MTVTIYRSTDASAPVLSGTVGALTTLLDAVLVTGYGAQPAAGWTKPSLGGTNPTGNTSVYQQGTGSNGFYLRVNDTGTRVGTTDEAVGTPTVKEARVRGYEIMNTLTDPATPSNPFPTVVQQPSGEYIRKSTTADATARPWIIAADQRTLYLFVLTGDAATVYLPFLFGEFYSLKQTSDPGRALIIGRTTENSALTSSTTEQGDIIYPITGTVLTGHYLVRNYNGAPGAVTMNKCGDYALTTFTGAGALIGSVVFTNTADARIYIGPVYLTSQVGELSVRGRMRGFWHFCHPVASAADGDTFVGSNDLTGKSFVIIKGTGNTGVFCIETTNTWETN